MVQFVEDIGFKLLTSTPNYAQANGQDEAANKNIISIIKRKTKCKPQNWHKVLDEALWACRTSDEQNRKCTVLPM